MPKNDPPYLHSDLTNKVICCFYNVYNALGTGFLEKVYENALAIELEKHQLNFSTQSPVSVFYDGQVVGEYLPDVLVEGCIIIEIKAVKSLTSSHEAQLLNYLKATTCKVGLLLNFGPEPQIKRRVF